MKENLVRDKGWALLRSLFLAAKRDMIIDFDEQRILKATDENVMKLLNAVIAAWEDKILTEKEKQQITFLVAKIRDDAISLAEYDDIITDQEEELLQIIADRMMQFMLLQ